MNTKRERLMKTLSYLVKVSPIFLALSFQLRAQWVPTNGPYRAAINAFAVSGTDLYVGTFGAGIFRSTDNGTTWTSLNNHLPWTSLGGGDTSLDVTCIAFKGANIFVGVYSIYDYLAGVFRSTNLGATWSRASSGLWDNAINDFAVIGNCLFAATSGSGVYLSTDDGTTWKMSNTGLTNLTNNNSLAVRGTHLFVGNGGCGAFRSTDNANTWLQVNSGLMDTLVTVLEVLDHDLYAGTYRAGVFRSTDDGASWNPIDSGLTRRYITSLASDSSHLFAASYRDGVYISSDTGKTWIAANSGLSSTAVTCLIVSGAYLFVGADNGVWRRPIAEMVTEVAPQKNPAPNDFHLFQNFPNPFNPTTLISFSIPTQSFVSLKIFDITGRLVAILQNNELPSGVYSRQWDATKMASGVYFCRMQAGSFVQIRKFLLIR